MNGPVGNVLIELGSEIDHLCFADITPESAAVENTVAVPGELAAEILILEDSSAPGPAVRRGKPRKTAVLLTQQLAA